VFRAGRAAHDEELPQRSSSDVMISCPGWQGQAAMAGLPPFSGGLHGGSGARAPRNFPESGESPESTSTVSMVIVP